jgi:hypothetical protein
MMQHESPLIRQGMIRRGAGKGQIWTCCLHPNCGATSTGRLVSTDLMPVLAQASADAHLAEHRRADKALTP